MTLFSNKNVTFDVDNDGLTITFHEDQSYIHVGKQHGSIGVDLDGECEVFIGKTGLPILSVGDKRVPLDKIVKAIEVLTL